MASKTTPIFQSRVTRFRTENRRLRLISLLVNLNNHGVGLPARASISAGTMEERSRGERFCRAPPQASLNTPTQTRISLVNL